MQCISSVVLALVAAATLVVAAPAPAPMPAPTAAAVFSVPEVASVTSTVAQSIATPAPAFKARGATVDSFAAKCTVGSDSVATCTGAIHATNVWAGTLDATVDSSTS
ncbi:hypothetical protein J7T55_001345 [Diaporthe amygdali]|uniref:uncharacterized protein n=1 Tax=Phomopsis amygdali TaxID=1214568 RepID=UPI0022FE08F1|nr:uncharacterized protein J7T55_001345 [Diaporthe amygdali]KAJ0106821.1 hypothetical protein J7T55_001345 [Diaporthe amygdali]